MSAWPDVLATILSSGYSIKEPGLKLWYNFNDAAALTRDCSGNGSTGTNSGGTAIIGASGGGIAFDGVSGTFTRTITAYTTDQSFTIEGWIYIPTAHTWNTSAYVIILGVGAGAGGYGIVAGTTENTLRSAMYEGSYRYSSNYTITRDTWYHNSFVYDGTLRQIFFYVNGVLFHTSVQLNTGYTLDSTLRVSGNSIIQGSGATYTNMYADEVRLYERALTADEVYAHYSTPSPYATIPYPLADGYSDTPQDGVIRSEMDMGPAKVRTRFTAASNYRKFQLALSRAQRQILDQFYDSIGGSAAFDYTCPDTGEALSCRFKGKPLYSLESAQYYRANVELEVLP